MINKNYTFSFDSTTNLFYYTLHTGQPIPIGCKYDGKITIFLNLSTDEREQIKVILKKVLESHDAYLDVIRGDKIKQAFNNLLNLSTKRIVYAVTQFDIDGFKVLSMPNTARSSKPRNVSVVLSVPYNKIPNELRRIVKGIVDNGSYLIEDGRTYLPTIIYTYIESCRKNTKPTTSKEVEPGDMVFAPGPDEDIKPSYEIGVKRGQVMITKKVGNRTLRTITIGTYKNGNRTADPELKLDRKFESYRRELFDKIWLAHLMSCPRTIDTDAGDRIFAAADVPDIDYKPVGVKVGGNHDHITENDIETMEKVVQVASDVAKHLGKSVSENIEPELFEEKLEKISEKTEPDIKPSEPVRDINTKDEKDSDLVGKLNDFDIKLVPPTKKASISLSNKLLLI